MIACARCDSMTACSPGGSLSRRRVRRQSRRRRTQGGPTSSCFWRTIWAATTSGAGAQTTCRRLTSTPSPRGRAVHQLVLGRAGLRSRARRAAHRTDPIRAGVPDNGPPLPDSEETIASAAQARGLRDRTYSANGTSAQPIPPNAHGFDRFFGFKSGCIDYYSHRYYWGEPRMVNYHDLWRDRTEIFEDGQYSPNCSPAKPVHSSASIAPTRSSFTCRSMRRTIRCMRRQVHGALREARPERRTYAAMIAAVDDALGQVMRTLRDSAPAREHTGVLLRR